MYDTKDNCVITPVSVNTEFDKQIMINILKSQTLIPIAEFRISKNLSILYEVPIIRYYICATQKDYTAKLMAKSFTLKITPPKRWNIPFVINLGCQFPFQKADIGKMICNISLQVASLSNKEIDDNDEKTKNIEQNKDGVLELA
jgi:hypothetical protein